MHAIEPERLLSDRTWTQWKAAAGLAPAPADPDLAVLGAAVSRACQITAPGYLGVINDLPRSGLSLIGEDAAASNMLYSMLWAKPGAERGIDTIQEAFGRLSANPTILADLREVAEYQRSVTACAGHKPYPLPLELHGQYTNSEIQAAFGRNTFLGFPQTAPGVLAFKEKNAYVLLITLNKSDKDFSATTLYKDYPINQSLMHWESQGSTTQASSKGQDLIDHTARGYSIYLFTRLNKKNGPLTAPYQFLGRGKQVSYSGERPISMVWQLEYPMPAELLEANRVGG